MSRLQTLVSLLLLGAAPNVLGQTTATNESEMAPVTHMDAGSFHTVVIIEDSGVNVVKAWGANGKGQLGLNDTKDRGDTDGDVGNLLPEVNVGNGLQATMVTAGLRHTAAILDDNTVRAWGYNAKGQLGIGTNESVGDEQDEMGDNLETTELGDTTPIYISAGGWHTCAIMEGNRLKCWGYNQWGELGLEDRESRGDEPDEMGNNLPFVDFGDGVEVESISLGDWHTCAILTTGELVCFGKNSSGQLGLGNVQHRGDGEGEMGYNNRINFGGLSVTSVSCGEEHTCAILEGGELRCWGLGLYGQLGQGSTESIGDDPNEMENLDAIDLGTERTAVEVSAGGNHTCALLDNGQVKCWGSNEFGELGQGDTMDRGNFPGQMGDNLEAIEFNTDWEILSISVGYDHSCALVDPDDGAAAALCWGANYKGQLGLGLTEAENIGDEEGEMGDNLELANLLGVMMEDDDGDEFYEQIWFYVVVAVGVLLCLCFCFLIVRSHSDGSGASIQRPVAGKHAESADAEDGDSKASPPVGRPHSYSANRSKANEGSSEGVEIEEGGDSGTAAGSPNADPSSQGTKTDFA